MRELKKLGIVLWCLAALALIILGIVGVVQIYSGEYTTFENISPILIFLGCGMFIPVIVPFFAD